MTSLTAGSRVTDRVTLVKPLASGAMGTVWIADHATLKTQVAVKFLAERTAVKRHAAERFSREAAAAAKIASHHVVRTFDHGVTPDGTPFIVMELLQGEALDKRLKRLGKLDIGDCVTIVDQLCKAVEASHALHVIHRDIKPSNVFVTEPHGELLAKLCDFGIAKSMGSPLITEPGMVVGTPAYMSPDMLRKGSSGVGPEVDLWAVAVVAYRCLTGVLPFRGDTPKDVCAAILRNEYRSPREHRPELPAAVDDWFARAFDDDPKARLTEPLELRRTFAALFAPSVHNGAPPRRCSLVAAVAQLGCRRWRRLVRLEGAGFAARVVPARAARMRRPATLRCRRAASSYRRAKRSTRCPTMPPPRSRRGRETAKSSSPAVARGYAERLWSTRSTSTETRSR